MNRVIVFIFILIIVAIIIIYASYINEGSGFGVWVENRTTQCVDGEITIIEDCVPNPITGKGCLVDNSLLYGTRQRISSCIIQKQRLVWKESVGDCITGQECVAEGSRGSRTNLLRCIENDNEGINSCVITEEQNGVPSTVEYNEGDTVTLTEVCYDYTTPICELYQYIVENTLLSDISAFLEYNYPINKCITENMMNYEEGYILQSLLCDSICGPLLCNSNLPPPSVIPNAQLSTTFNPVFCGEELSILIPCRRFEEMNYGDIILNRILNDFISLSIDDEDILAIQTPNITNSIAVGIDWLRYPNDPLIDLQFTLGNFDIQTLYGISPIEIIGSTIKCKILCIINDDYKGWLKTIVFKGRRVIIWTQANDIYGGLGTIYKNTEVFTIVVEDDKIDINDANMRTLYVPTQDTIIADDSSFIPLKSITYEIT